MWQPPKEAEAQQPPLQQSCNSNCVTTKALLKPISRTYQYRKIMKPLLERRRRARINRCLEELKQLITGGANFETDTIAKLEKADILELTVCHLQRQRDTQQQPQPHIDHTINMSKYWAGFQRCALEVAHFLQKYDQKINEQYAAFMERTMAPTLHGNSGSSEQYETNAMQQVQQVQQGTDVHSECCSDATTDVWRPW